MRNAVFMLAESAFAAEGRLFIHGGGLRNVTPPTLPWVHPQLAFVIRLELEDDDFDRDHELQISFRAPSGEEVVPTVVVPLDHEQMPARADRTVFLNAALTLAGIPIGEPGPHVIDLFVDGEPAGTETLYVDLVDAE